MNFKIETIQMGTLALGAGCLVAVQFVSKSWFVTCNNDCPYEHIVTGFLIDSEDIRTLSKKILYLLERPNLQIKMGCQAKDEAKHRWRQDIIAGKTYMVYKEVASNK